MCYNIVLDVQMSHPETEQTEAGSRGLDRVCEKSLWVKVESADFE